MFVTVILKERQNNLSVLQKTVSVENLAQTTKMEKTSQ